mmetsp:Transcript_30244/g.46323  ORF Transcript_30244/g.46323 Transcript_30244/m.46323 type:complete len:301 (-) Transcript_30244:334-1236(-)|eukprot:CAMPEP_0118679480 /NCGR_PEP_ID=MMETSP0800-20121206/3812_1 /TAXON_ID=210618 ORGANISM="Striatella unipunctata, Strain CCMP2910" /NCGR_SAMPLE_ID=MMETSP0800 /ASSEMBLY_ACC=CAM_ASM_000638 /LENGTH=300 /DNA_ID=CAMNT_0006575481 /DNA_START=117 /DNA_END=1019 /DNA_ORIENTATION=+
MTTATLTLISMMMTIMAATNALPGDHAYDQRHSRTPGEHLLKDAGMSPPYLTGTECVPATFSKENPTEVPYPYVIETSQDPNLDMDLVVSAVEAKLNELIGANLFPCPTRRRRLKVMGFEGEPDDKPYGEPLSCEGNSCQNTNGACTIYTSTSDIAIDTLIVLDAIELIMEVNNGMNPHLLSAHPSVQRVYFGSITADAQTGDTVEEPIVPRSFPDPDDKPSPPREGTSVNFPALAVSLIALLTIFFVLLFAFVKRRKDDDEDDDIEALDSDDSGEDYLTASAGELGVVGSDSGSVHLFT